MNILIIEDSKAEAAILTQTLERMMDQPVTIEYGETLADAVELLNENHKKFDLLFLDLKLPDSTEWDQTYAAVAPYAEELPIIVLTGDEDKDIARALLKSGAEDYIVKGSRKRQFDMLKESVDFAMCRHELVKMLASRVEQEQQCANWLTGSYSVE